mmetsp:Transcript_16820/g.22558  ORF Transcript_16820/g.22558 Transcript_16820/m.22558 type:complete len:155 (+) Transcript_16820:388-852(+)
MKTGTSSIQVDSCKYIETLFQEIILCPTILYNYCNVSWIQSLCEFSLHSSVVVERKSRSNVSCQTLLLDGSHAAGTMQHRKAIIKLRNNLSSCEASFLLHCYEISSLSSCSDSLHQQNVQCRAGTLSCSLIIAEAPFHKLSSPHQVPSIWQNEN